MDIENNLGVAKGERVRDGMKWEARVSGCKLLHVGWMDSKFLLFGTENWIQYFMINHNGNIYFLKEYIYIILYIIYSNNIYI